MTGDPRPIRISDPIDLDERWITFAAKDPTGDLRIRVGRLAWERLQSDVPDEFNADDRRDYALGMIEIQAAGHVAITTPTGRLLTLRSPDS